MHATGIWIRVTLNAYRLPDIVLNTRSVPDYKSMDTAWSGMHAATTQLVCIFISCCMCLYTVLISFDCVAKVTPGIRSAIRVGIFWAQLQQHLSLLGISVSLLLATLK